jgi:heptaprenyl diphosphate synthase
MVKEMLSRIRRAGGRSVQSLLARPWTRSRPELWTPSRVALAAQVAAWAREYLTEPHPQLGRQGPVCPFVQAAMNLDRLGIAFEDAVDGTSPRAIRSALLRHAGDFRRHHQGSAAADGFNSRIIVFPHLPSAEGRKLDEVHAELKTQLMEQDTMVSAFHPLSEKPSLANASFHVFRAPFAAFALRRMDVRDIVFLAHNRRAFARYRERFGAAHAKELVSDEFGYATAYREALNRFR